jgi:hypothetical protein
VIGRSSSCGGPTQARARVRGQSHGGRRSSRREGRSISLQGPAGPVHPSMTAATAIPPMPQGPSVTEPGQPRNCSPSSPPTLPTSSRVPCRDP